MLPRLKGKSAEADKLKPKGKPKKKKGKGKGKDKGNEKSKDKANDVCFHCQKEGHWKRNHSLFLGSVKEKKHGDASTSGMFTIEINFSSVDSASWVLDTGCGSHICNMLQILRNPRELRKNEVNLRVGNGARVAALAIGDVDLCLPTGFSLHLKNCFYVPSIFRNIISISALEQSGFHFIIKDGKFSIIMNDLVYACASRVNGLYVLDLESTSDILSIQAKKPRLDSRSYLWHCRLGHINETRQSRLHHDGYLDTMDFESFGSCESCLAGKMMKTKVNKLASHRANELLELIHSDVCGPMSTQARGGYSYFITFTDDKSRFGYVYLMRHKSEAFEKFKEFRNEVEKQLGKMIKTL